MEKKQKYNVIGLMSGTSLDGLDVAHCTFENANGVWRFRINAARTFRYNSSWTRKLAHLHELGGEDLTETDVTFGRFIGKTVRDFILTEKLKTDFIASHGHTVFHQPRKGFTLQIGNGNAIHAETSLPVVYDFRSLDVLRGGEGAPLVPAGDKLLFSDYDVCLNLGGIANLSLDRQRRRIAFDVCYANMALNYLAAVKGKTYDRNGAMSASGEVDKALLRNIRNQYGRLRKTRPSLGREGFEKVFRPLLSNERIAVEDRLATVTESIALEITEAIPADMKNARVLCTGGGAFNSFLMSRMLDIGGDRLTFILPDDDIIKFKEAIIFGFLGLLRILDQPNCLKSVTKARQDSSAGILVGF